MNDEIKEILEYWKFYINEPSNYKLLNVHFDEIKKVLDYITNLQQENQKYKEVIDKLKKQPTVYLTKYLSDLGFVETKTLNELIEELENDILKEVE